MSIAKRLHAVRSNLPHPCRDWKTREEWAALMFGAMGLLTTQEARPGEATTGECEATAEEGGEIGAKKAGARVEAAGAGREQLTMF